MDVTSKVKASVTEYIKRNSADGVALKSTLDRLADRLPETLIFGGMLRDFALGGARDFSSDVDLVSFANYADIFKAIREFSPVLKKVPANRGLFALVSPLSHKAAAGRAQNANFLIPDAWLYSIRTILDNYREVF
jgi:hypothetical protein